MVNKIEINTENKKKEIKNIIKILENDIMETTSSGAEIINMKKMEFINLCTDKQIQKIKLNGGVAYKFKVKNGRKGKWITRKNKSDLISAVYDYYTENEREKIVSINSLLPNYIDYKNATCDSSTTARYINSAKKYFLSNKICEKEIGEITVSEMIRTLSEIVIENNLTKKQYQNFMPLVNEIFALAVEDGLINRNIMKDVSVPKTRFKKVEKKEADKSIYTMDELQLILAESEKRAIEQQNERFLAINLILHSGLRSGEMFGLKFSDVDYENKKIHVHSMWKRVDKKNSDSTSEKTNYCLVDHLKRRTNPRAIDVPDTFFESLDLVKKIKKEKGIKIKDDDLIFVVDGAPTVYKNLLNVCEYVGVENKSVHGLRRTYASFLYRTTGNIMYVSKQLGHSTIKTTIDHYIYDMTDTSEHDEFVKNVNNYFVDEFVAKNNRKQFKIV